MIGTGSSIPIPSPAPPAMTGSSPLFTGEFPTRYQIDRELGSGATSNVFLARDREQGRLVALKVLRRELAESLSVERFLREVRVTARLRHPHIAPILDSGAMGDRPYCVLPYMEGGTLRNRLEREKQLPLADALTTGAAIAHALDHAHSQNVIHRDVKPENILFTGDGQACLADFGIARAIEGALTDHSTTTGVVRGTPAYMSPEQAAGERDYDGRSDVYSLGCVLYEMVAGVPAFVGPTSQSILAQRLTHMPQPLRVYRPTAPAAVQRVVERALATSPADRFQTAGDLAASLDDLRSQLAAGTLALDGNRVPLMGRPIRTAFAALAALSLVGLAYAAYTEGRATFFGASALDSTQVAIFALGDTADSMSASDDLLRAGVRRWLGLSVVPQGETVDAMQRHHVGRSSSPADWRSVASDLRAGRYILARIARTPAGRVIAAEYRDASIGLLHSVELPLPSEANRIADAYRQVADSLLLRGAADGAEGVTGAGPRSLFAMQAFVSGLAARSEWNLARADSLFASAIGLDPGFTRAHLWLAQVRLWRGLPSSRWASSVERAESDSVSLTSAERQMSGALSALVRGEFTKACDRYRSLIEADSNSFIGWYGLGDCTARDHVVLRDPRSPSGWRFRSSYNQAIKAYVRAFELLPATYHGFQAGGYGRLRELLFTSTRALVRGTSPDSAGMSFLGRPRLIGDSIVIIPFEQAWVLGGDTRAAASQAAVDSMRSIFHQVASRWAAAFPQSADAKEAIAVSLELQGEPAALDSMRLAARLATDPLQRLRYAAACLLLQLKFSVPDGLTQLRGVRHQADSLLAAHPNPGSAQAAILAPVAALAGRCRTTAELLRKSSDNTTVLQREVPQAIAADAYALRSYAALRCAKPADLATLGQIATRIDQTVANEETRQMLVYTLLAPAATLDSVVESAMLVRLARSGDALFGAMASQLAGDTAKLRSALLSRVGGRRAAVFGDFTPDAALPEARLFLMLHDTAAADGVLDASLAGARAWAPFIADEAAYNVSFVGALVAAMELRAEIAGPDRASARRWSRATLALWENSEALSQGTRSQRLSRLAAP